MFNHILVPLDGSFLAECALPHARALAQAFGARVTLLRIVEGARGALPADPLSWRLDRTESQAYLNRVAVRLKQDGLRVEVVSLEGEAAARTIGFVADHDVDLILLSSHGQSGLDGWNVSSVVHRIILRARVSVMVVGASSAVANGPIDYQRLLVPLGYSRRTEQVLPLAVELARRGQAELVVVRIISKPQMLRWLPHTQEDNELAERIMERGRLEAERYHDELQRYWRLDMWPRLLVSEDIVKELYDLIDQEKVDLVVMSAHGYSGETGWPYDSVVIHLITYGTKPLLIIQDLSSDDIGPSQAELAARERQGH
jgi:nucleotide-binding universal stress UspA family protein